MITKGANQVGRQVPRPFFQRVASLSSLGLIVCSLAPLFSVPTVNAKDSDYFIAEDFEVRRRYHRTMAVVPFRVQITSPALDCCTATPDNFLDFASGLTSFYWTRLLNRKLRRKSNHLKYTATLQDFEDTISRLREAGYLDSQKVFNSLTAAEIAAVLEVDVIVTGTAGGLGITGKPNREISAALDKFAEENRIEFEKFKTSRPVDPGFLTSRRQQTGMSIIDERSLKSIGVKNLSEKDLETVNNIKRARHISVEIYEASGRLLWRDVLWDRDARWGNLVGVGGMKGNHYRSMAELMNKNNYPFIYFKQKKDRNFSHIEP